MWTRARCSRQQGIIPREWDGITAEGYTIRGYFENGKVTSFYFD